MISEKALTESCAELPGGVRMPLLGFGTFPMRGAEARTAVVAALDIGYRHLDTAMRYRNEDQIGLAVKDSGLPRDALFLTTKMPPDQVGNERESIEKSLRALDTSYIDLYLLHWPPGGYPGVDSWRALIRAREEGLVRAIGVSNYSLRLVDALIEKTGEAPAVCQVAWSPMLFEHAVLSGFQQRGVVLSAHSPFKQSKLDHPVLLAIASAHGKSTNQVIVRWNLQHGVAVVPKSSVPERMAGNADVFDFELTQDQMAALDGLTAV